MAKQTGILQFTGKLGNLIGYRRNGKYFMRSMPEKVMQTTATRRASAHFGIASKKAKLIRKAISPHLEIGYDGSLVNRLNKAVLQNGAYHLEDFRWNRHAGTKDFFADPPLVSPDGRVVIPAQTLALPGNATHLHIKVMAIRICFASQRITARTTRIVRIELNTPFKGAVLEADAPGKGALFLVMQVQAFNGTVPLLSRRCMAADIIRVVVPTPTKRKPLSPRILPSLPVYGKGRNIPVACLRE